MKETSEIYNDLLRFEKRKRGPQEYPIHKKLRFKEHYADLLDWLVTEVSFTKEDHVLDAGCGTGYALFYLSNRYGLSGRGISISPEEITYANLLCSKKNMDVDLKFELDNYQHHHSGPYTRILAIESLKHASNLEISINNLISMLKRDGQLIIIDDFTIADHPLIGKHKILWNAPGFNHPDTYIKHLADSGNYLIRRIDLTSSVNTRSKRYLNFMCMAFSIMDPLLAKVNIQNIYTYWGGLILEKLYLENITRYMAIIIEKIK